MTQWFATHGWMAWVLFALLAIVVQRLRRRGGDEPLLRRIEYALFPHTAPANPNRREVTVGMVVLVAGGLVAIALLLFIVAVSVR